ARAADSMKTSYSEGAKSVSGAGDTSAPSPTGASATESAPAEATDGPPAWARRMKRSQAMSHGVTAVAHAVRSGDSHGGGTSINLSQGDR
ncbi:MAG: type IV secretion system protein TrbL, partial [Rhodospirillaceae bacterium]